MEDVKEEVWLNRKPWLVLVLPHSPRALHRLMSPKRRPSVQKCPHGDVPLEAQPLPVAAF
jgi:hypothetical protein